MQKSHCWGCLHMWKCSEKCEHTDRCKALVSLFFTGLVEQDSTSGGIAPVELPSPSPPSGLSVSPSGAPSDLIPPAPASSVTSWPKFTQHTVQTQALWRLYLAIKIYSSRFPFLQSPAYLLSWKYQAFQHEIALRTGLMCDLFQVTKL